MPTRLLPRLPSEIHDIPPTLDELHREELREDARLERADRLYEDARAEELMGGDCDLGGDA